MDMRQLLSKNRPVVFDGAMGTYYASLPGRQELRCELANIEHPQEVLDIHKAYLAAGCDAIKTNTFTVSADYASGASGMGRVLIEAGCRLALEAAEPYGAPVFADIGPVPQGAGVTAGSVYCSQADAFIDMGVTSFIMETLSSDDGIAQLAKHIKRRRPEAYLIVCYAVGSDGVTWEGRTGRELMKTTAAIKGVDSVGFNCGSGPHHLLEFVRSTDTGGAVLSVMPNAGYPSVLGNRVVYKGRPDYYAMRVAQIAASGASIVGGCCGTTPEHIGALVRQLAEPPKFCDIKAARAPRAHADDRSESPVWKKLEAGERVIAVELDPPVDDDAEYFMKGVKALSDAGADLVTIADCPVGRPRADSSMIACKIHRELGVEPLPHMTCRDRNLNAIKALLLGLSIEGVKNVLLVTGDPIPADDRSEVKSVFNFNSRKLARYVTSLNETGLKAPFHIFAALDLNARNFDVQLALAREKESCGAQGFLTQPVLSERAFENIKRARSELSGKLLGGVFPVVSYRNAMFLNNEIAGMHVSDEIIALYEDKDKRQCEELAVRISVEVAQAIEPYTDGLYLMTPFKRVELMTSIMARLKQK